MSRNNDQVNHEAISARFVQFFLYLYSIGVVPSKYAFCREIGMRQQNFHPIETGERCVSLPMICNAIVRYDLNPRWIMTGSGRMISNR